MQSMDWTPGLRLIQNRRMNKQLPLRCQCGTVRGVLHNATPRRGDRIRCYCRDCQTYAHHLDQAERVLDGHGGTGLFQTTPGGLEITQGRDQLACLRLSPKGPLRWYASCCNTPLANTLATSRIPFVALLQSAWDGPAEEILGAKEVGVYGSHATGDRSQIKAYAAVPASIMLKVGARLLRGRLRGEHRHSPFFDASTGRPVVTPKVLDREERAAALQRSGAR